MVWQHLQNSKLVARLKCFGWCWSTSSKLPKCEASSLWHTVWLGWSSSTNKLSTQASLDGTQELDKAFWCWRLWNLVFMPSRKMDRKIYHNTCDIEWFTHSLRKEKTLFSCLRYVWTNQNSLSIALAENFSSHVLIYTFHIN